MVDGPATERGTVPFCSADSAKGDSPLVRREVLAVVQARGGSKGLPGKNLRPLRGHPLVAYSIVSGLAARAITRLIVSTDDEEIASVSREYGAETPFRRPAELAADDTPDYPLFVHALDWLAREEGYRPEMVVQLRPTTPLRPRGLLDEAVRLLAGDLRADCVRGVTIPKPTPYKMWRDSGDGYLVPILETQFPEPFNMPRQKLPVAYWQTGHVDAIRVETIHQQHSLTGRRVRPIMVDPSYCIDIDTPADFDLAERIIEQKHLDIDEPQSLSAASADRPRRERRSWPVKIGLVVFDFDGVMTDNRVLVLGDGNEAVLCNRSDGLGLDRLRQTGIPLAVLSTETHGVVAARCRKLGLECRQGLTDKAAALTELAQEKGVSLAETIYVGNDTNDLGCMALAGFSVAVADSHPSALTAADWVLTVPGGGGAVRQVCDAVCENLRANHATKC